ncbi:MAG: dTDP-4-dehydrorhamnose reductase [Polyangiaceae bacterium]|nr:dTDP-4-dehydrorhamnose reductase [Polyangiaceae bacterium]
MRVLLLGQRGQVGSELAPLFETEHEVLAPTRSELDLAAKGAASAFISRSRPALVINAAAMTDVDAAERQPELAERINAIAVREIAEACSTAEAALVHLSTDFVFPGTSARPYVEGDETGPVNAYGRSKLAGEIAALEACERSIVLRTSWVQSLRRPCFVTRMIERLRTSDVALAADDQVGSPTAAADLSRAIRDVVAAVGDPRDGFRRSAGLYHAAGDGAATRLQLTEAILRLHPERAAFRAASVVGRPAASFVTEAPRPLYTALDCGALEQAFGVRLPPWQDGIARMLAGGS